MLETVTRRNASGDAPRYVANDVSYLLDKFVNVCFVGAAGAGDREWALVDAGLPGSAGKIRRAAERLFGEGARPAAIILTHGHVDHVGAIHTLAPEHIMPVASLIHQDSPSTRYASSPAGSHRMHCRARIGS